MTASTGTPREIIQIGQEEFKIVWQDGHESLFSVPYLRRLCPCAMCVDELTRMPRLDPASVPSDLKAEKAQLVGNYAIAFQFGDGHSTGVYSFEKLREVCPCGDCAAARKKP